MEKGVRNLKFLTILIPRQYMTATYLILRQLALNNGRLPLFLTGSAATLPAIIFFSIVVWILGNF